MKKTSNPYHFLDTFCYRVPVLSLTFYYELIKKELFSFEDLIEIWKNSVIKEAIYLASSDLYFEIEKTIERKDLNKFKKIKDPLLKYLIRASTRCTPFGLFSGIGEGKIGKVNTISLKPIVSYKRKTTFDTSFLSELFSYFSKVDFIASQLIYLPNTSMYKIANQYRYIEYTSVKTKRSYSVEAIESNIYIDKILSESKKGRTMNELINFLTEEGFSYDESEEFIKGLIKNQVILSELELHITGNDILSELISILKKYENVNDITTKLNALKIALKKLDSVIGNDKKKYDEIIKHIKGLKIPFDLKYLFQTDLSIESHKSELNIKHAYDLKKILPILIKIDRYAKNTKLEKFKKAFVERYGDEEILLSHVLDIESGIGYIQNKTISNTTPFLNDIIPPPKKKGTQIEDNPFFLDASQDILYKKLISVQKNNEYFLDLTDEDFKSIELDWGNLPDTLSAFFKIIRINNEDQMILKGFSNGAGKLLGRFCEGNSKIEDHVKNITRIEQSLNNNKILAEIAHLPESRTGNILKRPHLRNYEIPYIAKSTVSKSKQLLIDDLYLSVQNDTIILKSKSLGKQVIPKLTNAHNFGSKSLPIYHFLCDLEFENNRNYLGFSWPKITEHYTFLPRVTYKKIILSKAKWVLNEAFIKKISISKNEEELAIIISSLRKEYNIPEFVQLIEHDNTLLIHMKHIESLKLFVNTIKNKKKVILEEFLFTDDSPVKKDKDFFSNEYLITLYKTNN